MGVRDAANSTPAISGCAPSRALEQRVAHSATDHVSIPSPPDCGQSPHSPPRSHPHEPCAPTLLPRLEQTTNCAPNTHPALPTRREDGRWKMERAWPRTCPRARRIGVQTHLTVSTRPIHRPAPQARIGTEPPPAHAPMGGVMHPSASRPCRLPRFAKHEAPHNPRLPAFSLDAPGAKGAS